MGALGVEEGTARAEQVEEVEVLIATDLAMVALRGLLLQTSTFERTGILYAYSPLW